MLKTEFCPKQTKIRRYNGWNRMWNKENILPK